MRYRLLGRTGLYVSELSLGTMTFGRATTIEQLDDNLGAARLELTLDEVSALPPEYPGWMLQRQGQGRVRPLASC